MKADQGHMDGVCPRESPQPADKECPDRCFPAPASLVRTQPAPRVTLRLKSRMPPVFVCLQSAAGIAGNADEPKRSEYTEVCSGHNNDWFSNSHRPLWCGIWLSIHFVLTWEEDKSMTLRGKLEAVGCGIGKVFPVAGKVILVIRNRVDDEPQRAAVPQDMYVLSVVRVQLQQLQGSGGCSLVIPDGTSSLGQYVRDAGQLPGGSFYYVATLARADVSDVFSAEDCKAMEVVLASIYMQ